MPKPLADAPGSGLHLHQALYDNRDSASAFADPAAPYELSETGRSFVAGQLAHARGMCAILAPLVNSYKRLGGYDEAPTRICWARNNRAALIRVPESTTGRTQVELRAPDPSCNPYLALAASLRAGLDGIANNLPLSEPIEHARTDGASVDEQIADMLPRELREALEELDWDPVIRTALGEPIYEQFMAAKELEWEEYRHHISTWELTRYLDRA
jgi:glutamine synthetase